MKEFWVRGLLAPTSQNSRLLIVSEAVYLDNVKFHLRVGALTADCLRRERVEQEKLITK